MVDTTRANVNGNNSTLLIDGSIVSRHDVTNGVISFFSDGGALQSMNSNARIGRRRAIPGAKKLGYWRPGAGLPRRISGEPTPTFSAGGDSVSATGDIFLQLSGVTISNLNSLIGAAVGSADPRSRRARPRTLRPRGRRHVRHQCRRAAGPGGLDRGRGRHPRARHRRQRADRQRLSEIFSPYFAGGEYEGSLAALASLDANGDGLINAGDSAFGRLSVWQDLDHDGVSDAGELTGLAALGITGINLGATPVNGYLDGQELLSQGTFNYTDGSTGDYVEVGFETELGVPVDQPTHSDPMQQSNPTGGINSGGWFYGSQDMSDILESFFGRDVDFNERFEQMLSFGANSETPNHHGPSAADFLRSVLNALEQPQNPHG